MIFISKYNDNQESIDIDDNYSDSAVVGKLVKVAENPQPRK